MGCSILMDIKTYTSSFLLFWYLFLRSSWHILPTFYTNLRKETKGIRDLISANIQCYSLCLEINQTIWAAKINASNLELKTSIFIHVHMQINKPHNALLSTRQLCLSPSIDGLFTGSKHDDQTRETERLLLYVSVCSGKFSDIFITNTYYYRFLTIRSQFDSVNYNFDFPPSFREHLNLASHVKIWYSITMKISACENSVVYRLKRWVFILARLVALATPPK